MEPEVTPAEAGNEQPAATEEVTPQAGETTPENPVEGEVEPQKPADPPAQEHDWKKRFDGVDSAHKKLSEEHARVIDVNVKLAEKNPEFLEHLAETDQALADKVSEKLHGKPFVEYKAGLELEGIKDSDPERYAREKRLKELEEREADRIEAEKAKFLEGKGIKVNDFDPSYQKVKNQLEVLNPKFVEENPERALEIAYNLAFPEGDPNKKAEEERKAEELAANSSKPGGMAATIDHKPAKLSPEAQAFANKMSELTGQ